MDETVYTYSLYLFQNVRIVPITGGLWELVKLDQFLNLSQIFKLMLLTYSRNVIIQTFMLDFLMHTALLRTN